MFRVLFFSHFLKIPFVIVLIIGILNILFLSTAIATENDNPRGLSRVEIRASDKKNAPVIERVRLYKYSYALVIGNDKYNNGWPALSNAIKDAKMIATALKNRGFEVTLKSNLSSKELKETLDDFVFEKGQDKDSRLLIWFAGHGHTVSKEGYLVSVDAPHPDKGGKFRRSAFSLRSFGRLMREVRSKHVLAVFDSCFSGVVFDSARNIPSPTITRATTLKVRQLISSGQADQKVSDNGMFRQLFLDALDGKEPNADANNDSYLTGTELGLFLHNKVTNLTENTQTPRYGKLAILGLDRGDFIFQLKKKGVVTEESSPPNSGANSVELVLWNEIKYSTDPQDFKDYLKRFPKGVFSSLAKRHLKKIKTEVSKNKKMAHLKQKLGMAPEAERTSYLGIFMINSTSPKGVLIQSIEEDTAAAKSDLKVGDIITMISGQNVDNTNDFTTSKLNYNSSPEDKVRVTINRQGEVYKLDIKLMSLADYIATIYTKAETGDSHSMYSLAMQYRFGQGLDKNKDKTREWLLKASKKGSTQAMSELGFIFQYGKGVKQNYKKALSLHRKAAADGVVTSIYAVAIMLENGQGNNKKDSVSALKYYHQAANKDHTKSMLKIANMLTTGELDKNPEKMIRLYKAIIKKNEDGRLEASSQLANAYLKGKNGLEINHKKAAFHARKALSFAKETTFEQEDSWPLHKKIATDVLLTVTTKHDIASISSKEIKDAEQYNGDISLKTTRFTVPIKCGESKVPFHIHVWDWKYDYSMVEDQEKWLKQARGCEMPKDILESFQKLFNIAIKNNVSYRELTVYALDKNKKPNIAQVEIEPEKELPTSEVKPIDSVLSFQTKGLPDPPKHDESNQLKGRQTAVYKKCVLSDAIHKAAHRGDRAFVEQCLKEGVDVNIKERNGWTPLHSASFGGQISIIKLLLDNKANVNAEANDHSSPMNIVKGRNAIQLLKKFGGKKMRN